MCSSLLLRKKTLVKSVSHKSLQAHGTEVTSVLFCLGEEVTTGSEQG